MSLKFTCTFGIVFLFSFLEGNAQKTSPNDPQTLFVTLKKVNDGEYAFDEYRYRDFPMYSIEKFSRNFHDTLVKRYKSIPQDLDSLSLTSKFLEYTAFSYRSYKNGDRSLKEAIQYTAKDRLKDTVGYDSKLKFMANAISGFKGGKQIVIVDADNDGDFADDKVMEYPIDFRTSHNNRSAIIDTLPSFDLHYQIYAKGRKEDFRREIQVYPFSNSDHIYILEDKNAGKRLNEYTLMLKLKDYYKGDFEVNHTKYDAAIQGWYSGGAVAVIKPDSISYDKNNIVFRRNFEFKDGDTLVLAGNFYELGIGTEMTQIHLRKLKSGGISQTGHLLGQTLPDQELTGLNGKIQMLSQLVDPKKKMTLIDFWGTWCGPCKQALPDLKKMYQKYGDQVNFISIAYDKDPERVKIFTDENAMNWFQAYVEYGNSQKKNIKNNLKITLYPTVIILDQHNKIIYRGNGTSQGDVEKVIAISKI